MLPIISGSFWQIMGGAWVLKGCPAGYFLDSQQCQQCPPSFYCLGGALPETQCTSTEYSLPGAISKTDCFPAVFVVVVINVPIPRPNFVDQTDDFQAALALLAGRSSDNVSLDLIQPGDDLRTTTVTSRVASFDAQTAAALFQRFKTSNATAKFTSKGLGFPTLISVQVTACVPGFELDSSQICALCPADYFCPGGSSSRQPCPPDTFAYLGANSSSSCIPVVFVFVSVTLQIPQNNFTSDKQSKFQAAMALTLQVSIVRVVIVSFSNARRTTNVQPELLVKTEVAAHDDTDAQRISERVDLTSLNENLNIQGLSGCSSISVTYSDETAASTGANFLPSVIGWCVGAVLMVLFSVACYFLYFQLVWSWKQRVFFTAIREAKPGQAASVIHLPPNKGKKSNGLCDKYTAEEVLGSGKSGCVVKATRQENSEKHTIDVCIETVAIKIIISKQSTFSDIEKQRLKREAELLQLVTRKQCNSAVHTADQHGLPTVVPQRANVCWFLLEVLGPCARSVCPLGEAGCIQLARDVLAALKVLHDETWVHCDVTPVNVLRCKERKDGYEYKLIDFGSALQMDHAYKGKSAQVATGSPAFRSPEMYFQPCKVTSAVDIWSLGVTMFELLVGRLPFLADIDSETCWAEAIAGDMGSHSPSVNDVNSTTSRQSMNSSLSKVIAKAMEKNPARRSAHLMPDI